METDFVVEQQKLWMISPRNLVFILVGGLISGWLANFMMVPTPIASEIGHLVNAINIVGMSFATGLFSFLTAGFIFSSDESRPYLSERVNSIGLRRVYFERIFLTLLITSIFSISLAVVSYFILTSEFYYITAYFYTYLPAILIATLFISLCLTSIAIAFAIFFDDNRLSTLLGPVTMYSIANIVGLTYDIRVWRFLLTRNLGPLSPHNLLRVLAVYLSGFSFESERYTIAAVGFVYSSSSLGFALAGLGIVAVILLVLGIRVLQNNLVTWKENQYEKSKQDKWTTETPEKKSQYIMRIRKGLRRQRIITFLFLVILLIGLNAGKSMYHNYLVNTTTVQYYRTSGISEEISTATWITYNVTLHPAYPGLFNTLHIYLQIIDTNEIGGAVSYYLGILQMTLSDFMMQNESTRIDLMQTFREHQTSGGTGITEIIEDDSVAFLCVMKIISDANSTLVTTIDGFIEIDQGAR